MMLEDSVPGGTTELPLPKFSSHCERVEKLEKQELGVGEEYTEKKPLATR